MLVLLDTPWAFEILELLVNAWRQADSVCRLTLLFAGVNFLGALWHHCSRIAQMHVVCALIRAGAAMVGVDARQCVDL